MFSFIKFGKAQTPVGPTEFTFYIIESGDDGGIINNQESPGLNSINVTDPEHQFGSVQPV